MIDALCSVIRRSGVSDSGAAARLCLHPSTVSRWKRECPDLAILLRTAREDFRDAQLAIITAKANSGEATSWRAAAWLLERVFPEDYAPRAKERALFQERFDAICAAEDEGGAIELPASQEEALQIVKNAAPLFRPAPAAPPVAAAAPASPRDVTEHRSSAPVRAGSGVHSPEHPLQNVKYSPPAGAR